MNHLINMQGIEKVMIKHKYSQNQLTLLGTEELPSSLASSYPTFEYCHPSLGLPQQLSNWYPPFLSSK